MRTKVINDRIFDQKESSNFNLTHIQYNNQQHRMLMLWKDAYTARATSSYALLRLDSPFGAYMTYLRYGRTTTNAFVASGTCCNLNTVSE